MGRPAALGSCCPLTTTPTFSSSSSSLLFSACFSKRHPSCTLRHSPIARASSQADPETLEEEKKVANHDDLTVGATQPSRDARGFDKDVSQVVRKTAATFAPRSSTKSKNPAVPGTVLYTIFEVQGYLSMALGGLLSFNLVFPSNEPDIWRLMGMWSVWMFTIPSLRARDCSSKEKDALNYLFIGIPLINVLLPIFWKSFAAVWSADALAFFITYAWKLDWISLGKGDD